MKKVGATEFRAHCLMLIDQVHDSGKPITITKRGKVVATPQPAGDEDTKPWLKLRGRESTSTEIRSNRRWIRLSGKL